MAPRANWKGYLRLSLVSCPIALYPASSLGEKVSFDRINRKTGNRLKQQNIDAETGEVVSREDIARGYEVAKAQYLIVEDEEIDAVQIDSTRTIEIDQFVSTRSTSVTSSRLTTSPPTVRSGRMLLPSFAHLVYLDQRDLPIEQLPLNGASLLSQVVVEGHDEEAHAPRPKSESLPPLEFGYTAFVPKERRYQPFNGLRPARSLGHPEYELVDLFGNGLPNILEFNEQVRYWRNRGDGRFDLMRTMETAPAGVRLSDPGVQLLDANGNGRADLMVSDGLRKGFFPLTFDGQWNEAIRALLQQS